jgi:hypothetical protein
VAQGTRSSRAKFENILRFFCITGAFANLSKHASRFASSDNERQLDRSCDLATVTLNEANPPAAIATNLLPRCFPIGEVSLLTPCAQLKAGRKIPTLNYQFDLTFAGRATRFDAN